MEKMRWAISTFGAIGLTIAIAVPLTLQRYGSEMKQATAKAQIRVPTPSDILTSDPQSFLAHVASNEPASNDIEIGSDLTSVDELLAINDARAVVASPAALDSADGGHWKYLVGETYLRCSGWRSANFIPGGIPSTRCNGMPEDGVADARRWLTRAASEGSADAWFALAALAPSREDQKILYLRAMELGSVRAREEMMRDSD
jgi:hypothetical protein